jgi:hypothetical protein
VRTGDLGSLLRTSLGSAGYGLNLCSLILLQTGVAEQVKCNFTLLESRVSSLSASIQWRTFASPCNFSLIYSSDTSGPMWCHPIRIDNFTYGCNPKDLQAGTVYNFRIVSLDGEESTLVLQTGKVHRCNGRPDCSTPSLDFSYRNFPLICRHLKRIYILIYIFYVLYQIYIYI